MMSSKLKEIKTPNADEGESFPTFVSPPPDSSCNEGERLEIRCIVEGQPPPKLSWKKGQWMQLDDGGRFEVTRNLETGQCLLAIKKVRVSDIGKYKAIATNDFGELLHVFNIKISQDDHKPEVVNLKSRLKTRKVKEVKKKTPEEMEKEVLEKLKTADPKDYERICMEYGFYDFRLILHKLQSLTRVATPVVETEAVKVLKQLRHVTVNDEGTAVFEIHMENVSPTKHMLWYKDGEIVHCPGPEKRHELRRIGNVFQLIIRNAKMEDAGTYTLDIGGERFDAMLTIKEQPLGFEAELRDTHAKLHGRCVFECVTTQRGKLVTWYKNGEEIKLRGTTGRLQAVTEGKMHKLIISELEKKDGGVYSVKLGDLESSAELCVTDPPIRFRHRLVNTEVKERESASFECSVSSKEVQPVWTVNGKPITHGGRYVMKTVGDVHSLEIKNAGLADEGATVEVQFGDVKSSASLHVNTKPIKILTKMTNAKCRSGESAEFSCKIDNADEGVEVQWFKDDQPIRPSKKYSITSRRGKHSLKIKNAKVEDEGLYQFQVRGCRQEGQLTCTDPPGVDKAFLEKLRKNPLKFKAGERGLITIPFTGTPPVGASWTNGRVTLTEGGRHHMEVKDDNMAVLEVANFQVNDAGVYELILSSENGQVRIEIPVCIVAKPPPPSGEVVVSSLTAKGADLAWNPPIDDEIPIDGYVVEIQDDTGSWKKIAEVDKNRPCYKATGLNEGEVYKFRVRSKNDEGLSEALESSSVVPRQPSEAPIINPEIIKQLENSTIVVKAGQTARIKVPCDGSPPPSAIWFHDGEEILPVKHHRATKLSSMNDVELKIAKCQGSDSGSYEARIFNDVGGITIKTDMKVLDVPDFSNSKIKIDKVTSDTVSISWDAPLEDQDIANQRKKFAARDDIDEQEALGTRNGVDGQTMVNRLRMADGQNMFDAQRTTDGQTVDAQRTTDGQTVDAQKMTDGQSAKGQIITDGQSAKGQRMTDGQTAKGQRMTDGQTAKGQRMTDGQSAKGQRMTDAKTAKGQKMTDGQTAKGQRMTDGQTTGGQRMTDGQSAGGQRMKDGQTAEGQIMTDGVEARTGKRLIDGKTLVDGQIREMERAAIEDQIAVKTYTIERAVSGTNHWKEVGKVEGGGDAAPTSFTAKGCEPETKYVFRITATNAQGSSKPVVSTPVTCRSAIAPPTVDQKLVEAFAKAPMTVKAGQTCRIKFPVDVGSPAATISWEKDGKPLEDDGKRIICDHSDSTVAHICMHKCSAAQDAGRYVCKIKNDVGEVAIPIDVKVLEAPSGVEGPIEISNVSSKGVDLTWQPTKDDGGCDVTHYVVEKREENRKIWTAVGKTDAGTTTTYRASPPAGKTYRFRVRAVTEVGESASRESEPVTVKDPFDPPAPVTSDILMEDSSNESITIGWSEVKADGGSPITGYIIEKRKKGTSTWNRCNETLCESRRYTAGNLRRDGEYEFRVIAVNQAGESSPSRASAPFVARDMVDAPGLPADLKLLDSTNSSLTFGWKATDQFGGAQFLGYDIDLRKVGSNEWIRYNESPINGTSFTVRGLDHGASYYARIRSVNSGSCSRYLTFETTFTANEIHIVPTFTMTPELETAVREGFRINAGNTIRIHVPFHARPRPVVEWTKDEQALEDTAALINDVEGVATLMIRNARAWHAGTYIITLSNASGCQSLSLRIDVNDVPSPPKGPLRLSEVNETGVTLNWRRPQHDGGHPIICYIVQKREARGRDWQTIANNVKGTEYTISDLKKQRSYYLRVLAENALGAGEPLQTEDMVYIKQQVEKVHIEDVQYDEKDLCQAPHVTVPLKPRTVPDGVKVTLSCSISGKPQPNIRWYKDGRDISDDSNYFKENVIGLCRLVLTSTKVSDTGIYKIVAENSRGTASSETSLHVIP